MSYSDVHYEWTKKGSTLSDKTAFKEFGLTYDGYIDKRFTRLKWIRHLLETNQLNDSLRWQFQGGMRASL